jgi:hypothetical protein
LAACQRQFTDPLVASYAADSRLTTRRLVIGVAGSFPARDRKVRHAFTISQVGCGTGGDGRHGRARTRRRDPRVRCGHVAVVNVDDHSGELVDDHSGELVDVDVRLGLVCDAVGGNGQLVWDRVGDDTDTGFGRDARAMPRHGRRRQLFEFLDG